MVNHTFIHVGWQRTLDLSDPIRIGVRIHAEHTCTIQIGLVCISISMQIILHINTGKKLQPRDGTFGAG
jgi:hypothetical protein